MSLANYSDHEIEEYKRCRRSPIYFINNYFHIRHPTKGDMVCQLYPAQECLIRAYHYNQHNITLSSRQSGGTMCMMAYALWSALFAPDKFTVMMVSNRLENARQLIRLIGFAIDKLPHWLKPKMDRYNKSELSFYNDRVKIIASAVHPATGRGYSIDLFVWDEAMFCRDVHASEMWYAIAPALASKGKAIISSSGTKLLKSAEANMFMELWYGAINQTNGISLNLLRWDEIPDRDEEFKSRIVELIGEEAWRREYELEFVFED